MGGCKRKTRKGPQEAGTSNTRRICSARQKKYPGNAGLGWAGTGYDGFSGHDCEQVFSQEKSSYLRKPEIGGDDCGSRARIVGGHREDGRGARASNLQGCVHPEHMVTSQRRPTGRGPRGRKDL